MARARRAKARPARIVVPLAIAVVLVGLVVSGAARGWFGGTNAATSSAPTVLATESTAPPSASTSPSASATAGRQPSSNASGNARPSRRASPIAERALADCRNTVRARDAVLRAAEPGVRHWAEHVDAQTEANRGAISTKTMDKIFTRTRLAGPAEVKLYRKARDRDHAAASCRAPSDAPASVASAMARCDQRRAAQTPVLRAARDAMADWQSHLGAMRRSRMGHVHNAQEVWIRAWGAAPPHISAYTSAASSFHAPRC